jgi:hypothetical protein
MNDKTVLKIAVEIDPLRPVRIVERALKRFPQAGKKINAFLQQGPCTCGQCKPWPEWCFLPAKCFGEIVTDELEGKEPADIIQYHMIELAALATWRTTQGIYLFHSFCRMELIDAPFTGVLPTERFRHLPQWCVYVDTPNGDWHGNDLYGFWAHLAWDSIREVEILVFVLDKSDGLEIRVVQVGPWSILEGIQRMFDFDGAKEFCQKNSTNLDALRGRAEEDVAALAPLVSMVLYLCSDTAEIEHAHIPGLRPTNPVPKKTRHGLKLFPPTQPTFWEVGRKTGVLLG